MKRRINLHQYTAMPKLQRSKKLALQKNLMMRQVQKKYSESDEEATNPPRDIFNIYYPTPDEMIVDLCSYAYDLVLKQLSKETKQNIFKDDGTEGMQIEKNVIIFNTSNELVANFSLNTASSKFIEDNVRTLTNQVK